MPNFVPDPKLYPAGAQGLKCSFGTITADGSNPTPVIAAVTGLSVVLAGQVTLKSTAAPADDPSWVSCDAPAASPGQLDIYFWKNTGGTDPTLVASTGTETFDWLAIGT